MRSRLLLAVLLWSAAAAQGQSSDAPGPVGGMPAQLPQITLPNLTELNLPVPRPVRAATAALGMGRQRLALVVGVGHVDRQRVVDNAARDVQAVAVALRRSGYVVIQREDLSAAELRTTLQDFRDRLQPEGVGFIYLSGLDVQLEGANVLLLREATLDHAPAAKLRQGGVALSEVTDALIGPAGSPRMLVVDAAYRHPALARLPAAGLAEQRLPVGTMALFSVAPGAVGDVPAVAPLPIPEPTDPREIAASPFAGALVKALATPRINGPDALRATRRALATDTLGQVEPWIGGDTDEKEEFAEATLLDGVLPRTPEEMAREAASRGARLVSQHGGQRAGEQSVTEVLQSSSTRPVASAGAGAPENTGNGRAGKPEAPGSSGLGTLGQVVGTAASIAGTLAAAGGSGVAAASSTATTTATAVAATSAAGTSVALAAHAVGTVTSVAGSAVQAVAGQLVGSSAPAAAAAATAATTSAASTTAAAAAPAVATPPVTTPPTAGALSPTAPAPAAPTTTTPPPTLATPVTTELAPTADGALPVAAVIAAAPSTGSANLGRAAASALAQNALTVRQGSGGERPAYAPRSNPFGYAEGDTFTYRITDTWKGEVTGQSVTAIEEVMDNGEMFANGQQLQMDAQGRPMRRTNRDGSVSEFEPAQELWWSNPKRGEGRAARFVETIRGRNGAVQRQVEWKGSTSVGRLREIQTAAGPFEALPIETSGWYYELSTGNPFASGQFTRTVWYAPKLGHPVAIDIEDADRLGKLLKRERIELLHAQSARTAAP